MPERSLSSWNYTIRELSHRGQGQEALQAFYQMLLEGSIPSKATYVCLMSAFTCQTDMGQGKRMHSLIMDRAFHLDVVVGTALVSMYVRCGSTIKARRLFDDMPIRNVITWTMMITAHGKPAAVDTFQFFDQMLLDGVLPNKVTFISLFHSCALLHDGKRMHAFLLECDFDVDVIVSSALVRMYGRCGSHEDARKAFDKAHVRNVVLWTAMIAVYADHGCGEHALQIYHQMVQEGFLPNKVTFITLLTACAGHAALALGKCIHACIMLFEFKSDVIIETALVSMYGKCTSLNDAWNIFNKMQQRNAISWNSMMAAYCTGRKSQWAFQLYHQMLCEGVLPTKVSFINLLGACASQGALAEGQQLHACILLRNCELDVEVQNALVSMYAKCGSTDDATRIFSVMSSRSTVSWNAMIAMHTDHKQDDSALQLLIKMWQEKLLPDEATFTSILIACANQAALTAGKLVYACVVEEVFKPDSVLGAALVNMYGKCGSVDDAWRVFVSMVQRDVVLWTAIISAYAQHGEGWQALRLFKQMQHEGVSPNAITFVSILLACCHAGLVNEGVHYFTSMIQEHGITPVADHIACMVNLLGRAGWVDEAEYLLHDLPCKAMVVSLVTLLSIYKDEVDMVRGENAANFLMELDPENTASYVLLSNMYTAEDRRMLHCI